jgi:uncharacterized protein YceK
MGFRAICVALLLSTLPVAGCGTVANLARQKPDSGGVAPFGGVKQDLACIHKSANGEADVGAHPKSEPEQYSKRALVLFCAADLPFSLVGDIVTWPYTVVYSYINRPLPTAPLLLVDTPALPVVPTVPAVPPMPIPLPPLPEALPEVPPPLPKPPGQQ